MRKRICVFIGEIAQTYQKTISREIIRRGNAYGYDVVFIANYGSYNEDILYAEGEKSSVNLPDCSMFDGVIVTEDVFDIDGMPNELYEILMRTAKCPVVYLRTIRPGCFSVLPENKRSIESVVEHFVVDHGFKEIYYMSGKKGTEDARERLEGYMNVMERHGLEVSEHMIFHGDYWRNKGAEAINWFLNGGGKYPQAIVCANDYMALSICDELRKRGVRVPQDVCVSGFDFCDEAKVNIPTLTSLEVDFVSMAKSAVEIIHNVNSGEEVERIKTISAKLRLQSSCGCGDQFKYEDIISLLSQGQSNINDTKNTMVSVTEYQYSYSFDEYMKVADRFRAFIRSHKAYMCFTDSNEAGFDEVENDSKFTRNMVLKRIFEDDLPYKNPDMIFPREQILPNCFWREDVPNNFAVFPIHFKNVVYGYTVAEIAEDLWFDIYTQSYFMTLANAIENSNIHQKIEDLETIRTLYQNDALTGILNRRGFDKILQERFADAQYKETPIAIASIDMDNLKVINDTFGHAAGDKALVTLAKCITSVLEEDDCCARIGGDEFAAILNITYPGRCRVFKKALTDALHVASISDEIKYIVEASVGVCESSETDSVIECIHLADKRMYEEKRNRKANRR